MPDQTKPCAECGNRFTPRAGGKPQRYCSKQCYSAAASQRRWAGRPVKTAPCEICGTLCRQYNGVPLCSDECKRSRVANGRSTTTPIVYRQCEQCGQTFIGKVRTNRRYCSRPCAQAASKKFYKHRRRTAERAGDNITIQMLGDRDQWTCHLCNRKVRKRFGNEPTAPSIDHLIPVSAGGPHVWANVALAHKGCNSRRRTGGIAQLRLR